MNINTYMTSYEEFLEAYPEYVERARNEAFKGTATELSSNEHVMKMIARYPDFAESLKAAYNEGHEDGKKNAFRTAGNLLSILNPITGDPDIDNAIRQARGDDFETQIKQKLTTGDPNLDAALAALYPDGKRVTQ